MKVLVLGANGMLGSMVATVLAQHGSYETEQTVRSGAVLHDGMPQIPTHRVNLLDGDELLSVLVKIRPDCVINCAGVIKQRSDASEVLRTFPLNALFPHRLAQMCAAVGSRMVHISTDCVFSGKKGNYADHAPSDVNDVYGVSKRFGEVGGLDNVLTLRTSIIGHEAQSHHSLIDWFLNQEGQIKGFRNAIFSGFPTIEIGNILANYILPRPDLHGIYNISSEPISKYDLLLIVKETYGKSIEIIPDDSVQIDRSLDSSRLRSMIGYSPPLWTDLISQMHATRPSFSSKVR